VSREYQQYEWAIARLREVFGATRVTVEGEADGSRVEAVIAPPEGAERAAYRLILKRPLLNDANRLADPAAFLEGEIRSAQAWFNGTSKAAATFG
jgi:hypothetical protein